MATGDVINRKKLGTRGTKQQTVTATSFKILIAL